MNSDERLNLLFQHASAYQFHDFTEAFPAPASLEGELPEAGLMRAQIKLLSADITFLDDMRQADCFDGPLRYPCLSDRWTPDSPNRFVVFRQTPEALRRFLEALPQAGEMLERWYPGSGAALVRQLESEILYFYGRFDDALALATVERRGEERPVDVILSLYVQFRCYLAEGQHERAEQCMINMIRISKTDPDCLAPYRVIRDWANLTTGWSGDNPRFADVAPGETKPILEDRLAAIRRGISHLSESEKPFVEYAEHAYSDACTMRQHYMDIFHAIYWLGVGEHGQAKEYFLRAYRVSSATGLIMPFAEYGKQIVPLLRHVRDVCTDCSNDWITTILSLAEQYEESLRAYRD